MQDERYTEAPRMGSRNGEQIPASDGVEPSFRLFGPAGGTDHTDTHDPATSRDVAQHGASSPQRSANTSNPIADATTNAGANGEQIASHAPYKRTRSKCNEWNRVQNAKRGAAKRAWEKSERGRGFCIDCGKPKGQGRVTKGGPRCWDCFNAMKAWAHDVRLSIVEGMWADGWTFREMSDTFGYVHVTGISQDVHELRQQGRAPLRRTPEQAARIREGRWGLRDAA